LNCVLKLFKDFQNINIYDQTQFELDKCTIKSCS